MRRCRDMQQGKLSMGKPEANPGLTGSEDT